LVGLTAGRSYQCARELQAWTFRPVSGLFPLGRPVVRSGNTSGLARCRELGADAGWNSGIGEEDRSERDVAGSADGELEGVAAGLDPAHPDDRQAGRLVADAHRVECDRLQRRAREAAAAAREHRAEPLVERGPAERVDER
jgi:hypothetical protein